MKSIQARRLKGIIQTRKFEDIQTKKTKKLERMIKMKKQKMTKLIMIIKKITNQIDKSK